MMDYKKITIYIALLAIVILSMVLLKDCSKTTSKPVYSYDPQVRDLREIREEGILRVVTPYNQIGYFIHGDTVSGFQYDLIHLFGKKTGLQVEIHPEMDLQRSILGLEIGNYDIIARNLAITAELRKKMNFTEPIILNKQVLVQRTAAYNNGIEPIRNQLDLAKKKLYVPESSPSLLRINNLSSEIGDTVYVEEMKKYESEQLIILVAKGEIDYAVCDVWIARKLKPNFPEIDIETDISFTQLNAWAVRKESTELLDSLNSWIRELKDNKEIEKIQNKYLN